MGFADDAALVEREPTWKNSEPYKSGGPHIRD
jgi:hypothetical protein